jgi:hypothetical protein
MPSAQVARLVSRCATTVRAGSARHWHEHATVPVTSPPTASHRTTHAGFTGCFLPRCHDCVLSISKYYDVDGHLVSWLSADVPSQRLPGYAALIDRLEIIDAEFSFWLRHEADIIDGIGVCHDLALRIRAQAEKRKTVPSLSGCK